jgi:hypothetical protein
MMNWERLTDEQKQPYFNKAIEILQDHLTCTRVWSAWSYGTMIQDDFVLAAEDDNIVSDTAKMLYDFTQKMIAQAKKEAVKEFAERAKENIENYAYDVEDTMYIIDRLLEEYEEEK